MGSSISCTDNGCDAWCTPQHANKVVPQSTPDIPVSDKAAAQPRSAHNSKRDVAPSAGPASSAAEATTVKIFDPPKEEARSPEPASPPHEVRSPVTSVCREDAPFYVIRKTEDVKNDYTIAEELGHGQFGVVSIAIEKSTGKKYAIKTMSKRKAATNPDFCKDVRAEVEIMYHLVGHANIVQLHDVYEDGESIHLIMELCQGGDWFARLLKDGTYSEVQAAATIRTILKALAYCHSLGVVHRDIKPENMIYSNRSEDAKIKLADFGLSAMMPQTVMAAPGWNRNDTKAGLLHETVGTPYYVAPEVLESCGYGQECDIWSMGVVVFICLGGYPPFNGGNQQQVFYAIKYKPLSFENPTWDHISEIAKDLIRRMLVKNPAKRATIPELLNHPWLSCSAKVSKGVAAVPDAVVARLNQFAAMNHFKKEARKVLASLLPEEEVMGLLNIFKEMDTDGNGVISLPELVSGLEKKGVKLPQEQAALMIKCADINSDGVVDYEEFLAGTVHQSRLEKDELMFKAFRKFDRDGCGFIKPQDLRDALSGHKTQVDVDSILQEIDADHDGRINYEEFCNCLRNKENSKNSYGSSLKKYTMKSAALSLLSNPKNSSQATQGHSELAVKHVAPSCLSESAISDMHASDHVFRQIFGSNLEVTKKKLKAAAA